MTLNLLMTTKLNPIMSPGERGWVPEVQKVSGQNCNYKCRKVKLKDFLQFLDNIRSQKRLKDFPQYANPNLYICQSKHFLYLAGDRVQGQVVQGVQPNFWREMQNQVKFSAETKKLLQRDNNKIKILVRAIFHQNVSLNYIPIYYMLRYHKHCKTTEKCTHIYQTVCTQAGYEQTCSQVRSSTP